ncbi:MAG: L-threonylcarbamoyladenylate synthase [Candidatus Omnitrophota bacterium]
MKKIHIHPEDIDPSFVKIAVEAILGGGIAGLPTETVYGLAALPEQKSAVERLYTLKQRPSGQPFTIAVGDSEKASQGYFITLPPFGYRLIEKFWPGPLTIIYYSPQGEKVGVRVPAHPVIREILRQLKGGVYLPSANINGAKESVSAPEVEAVFGNKIDLLVDGGESLYKKSSTIVDLTYSPFKVVREGVVAERQIIETFIKKRILFVCTGNSCRSPMAQFLLEKYLDRAKPYLQGRHEIISRGTSTVGGLRLSSAVEDILLEQEEMRIDNFSSRRIDRRIILSSDFIFTMEDSHTDYILRLEPTVEGRVFGLKKFLPAQLEHDIPDPIGENFEVYQKVYGIIKKAIIELTEWL